MAWASPWQVVRAMRMAQGAAWASGTVIGVCTCAGEARVEHKSCHQLADGVPLPACGEPGVIVMPEHATRTLPSGLAAYVRLLTAALKRKSTPSPDIHQTLYTLPSIRP